MITTKQIGSLTQLEATEGYLHLKGSDTYCKAIIMLPTQSIEDYEEVMELPQAPDYDYPNRVEQKIRQRYSVSEELAILRQRDAKPEEFAEYYEYAEQCKREAKEAPRVEE